MSRNEVMTRGARRSWLLDQKRDIVAESLERGSRRRRSRTRTAISSGQLYTWRRELLGACAAMVQRAVPRFTQVDMPAPAPAQAAVPAAPATAISCRAESLIEIVLSGGVSVRVDAQVDGGALRRVLAVPNGR